MIQDYRCFIVQSEKIAKQKNLHLDEIYSLCIKELSSQQSKRDQLIAFYIAMISFGVPAILGLTIDDTLKGIAMLSLSFVGSMFSFVVMRYRVYKEVYWVTSKVLSQLYNFKQEAIDKALVQGLFFFNLEKNARKLWFTNKNMTKIYHRKTFRNVISSAETLLYEVLVFLSSVVFASSMCLIFYNEHWFSSFNNQVVVGISIGIANMIYWTLKFYQQLLEVYKTLIDKSDHSFNKTYAKAWFLHFYLEDPKDVEMDVQEIY